MNVSRIIWVKVGISFPDYCHTIRYAFISKKTFAFIIPALLRWIYTDILDFAVHFHVYSCSIVRHSAKPAYPQIPWPDFLQKPHDLSFYAKTFCRSSIILDSTHAYRPTTPSILPTEPFNPAHRLFNPAHRPLRSSEREPAIPILVTALTCDPPYPGILVPELFGPAGGCSLWLCPDNRLDT